MCLTRGGQGKRNWAIPTLATKFKKLKPCQPSHVDFNWQFLDNKKSKFRGEPATFTTTVYTLTQLLLHFTASSPKSM